MKKWMNRMVILLCAALVVTMMPAAALGAVRYFPDVTKEMSKASYWSDKVKQPKRVLATQEGISALNQAIYKDSAETRDLAAWSKTQYDARQVVRDLAAGAEKDAAYLWDVCWARYHRDGSEAPSKDAMYGDAIALCKDPSVDTSVQGEDMRDYKYAICTTRTSLTVYPTTEAFQDDPGDPDFDYNYLTQVKVNEPVILRTQSTPLADGRFYYSALTCCGSGWIPADCVAICKDKQEWLEAWNYPSEQLLVVLDDRIRTEESNTQPETALRTLTMGTRLQLATEEEAQGQIGGRSAHNNHVVWMPVRNEDGTYKKMLALISESRKVSEGYPALTVENMMSVALNQLGDVYGWGSMLGTDDCSGYYRDVFSCFGLDLPRSTNRNNGVLKTYDLRDMKDSEKAAFIKTLPPGTNLTFSGHEMLYLGHEGDKLYVISSVYSVRMPGDDHNTKTLGTHINTLDVCRSDNNTWLRHMKEAMIPFYAASHEDYSEPEDAPAPNPGVKPADKTSGGTEKKPADKTSGKTEKKSTDKTKSKKNTDEKGKKSVAKKANPLNVKGKSLKIKKKALKKKAKTLKRAKFLSVKKAKGKVSYKLVKVTRKGEKSKKKKGAGKARRKSCPRFKIDGSTGNLTIRKRLKKGKYTLKIQVTAAGNASYKKVRKTVAVKIRIK